VEIIHALANEPEYTLSDLREVGLAAAREQIVATGREIELLISGVCVPNDLVPVLPKLWITLADLTLYTAAEAERAFNFEPLAWDCTLRNPIC
jgi:hypothetical protein